MFNNGMQDIATGDEKNTDYMTYACALEHTIILI